MINKIRTYAPHIVVARFIGRIGAWTESTPIVGGASCPALALKH